MSTAERTAADEERKDMPKASQTSSRVSVFTGEAVPRNLFVRNAYTVGQLKALLNDLPDALPVTCSLGDGISLTWCNIGYRDSSMMEEHLTIDEDDEDASNL